MVPHFAAKLKQELGEGIVDELYEKARQPVLLSREYLLELLSTLKGVEKQFDIQKYGVSLTQCAVGFRV